LKVALFCSEGDTTSAVANRLREEIGPILIVRELHEPRGLFLRRRVKKLGLVTVAGQVAFMALANPILRRVSGGRRREIAQGLDLTVPLPDLEVESINGDDVLEWLQRERPNVVVVNGTRIISKRILSATDAIFINTHCGITPAYRGSHGGYWALRDGGPCGVTVHLVDPGIDTGDIIGQRTIEPTRRDNMATYPLLQVAAALPVVMEAVRDPARIKAYSASGRSAIWYHPTLWDYLWTGLTRGIW
jgi:hypothetical protein